MTAVPRDRTAIARAARRIAHARCAGHGTLLPVHMHSAARATAPIAASPPGLLSHRVAAPRPPQSFARAMADMEVEDEIQKSRMSAAVEEEKIYLY